MKVKRIISKYSTGDNSLINDYNIDHIPVTTLTKILNVALDDPEVLKIYRIENHQLVQFMLQIPDLAGIETEGAEFYLECFTSESSKA